MRKKDLAEQINRNCTRSGCNMNFKELRERSGMSRAEFSKYFNIPYRTIQNWELENEKEKRKCPAYVLELIRYKLDNEKKKPFK